MTFTINCIVKVIVVILLLGFVQIMSDSKLENVSLKGKSKSVCISSLKEAVKKVVELFIDLVCKNVLKDSGTLI